jgi:hypothetical protein
VAPPSRRITPGGGALRPLPNLTAAENIALPTRIAGVTPDPLWVQSVIRIVGLTERLRHRPTELSGPVRDDLDADHPEFSTAVARDVAAVDGVRTVSAAATRWRG